MDLVYLDNASTTPLDPAVRAAMVPYQAGEFGNPSSRHPLGVQAAAALDEARRRVARAVGARADDVVFTSGGTEANNLAVLGFARAAGRRGKHVLFGPTEHPSVRASCEALAEEGFEVEAARVEGGGALDVDDLLERVRPDTALVALMLVNNEFGSIYPVARVARGVRARAPHARVHTDAVQALGKLDVSLGELDVDSLSISAHKIHGPKGTGALVLREGVRPRPIVFGGGQQSGMRPGTEDVAGAVGLGAATELATEGRAEAYARMGELRAQLVAEVESVDGARALATTGDVSAAVCAALLPGAPAEVWMHHLERRGVLVSVGSACQAREREASPALLALGLDRERAKHVLRISLSRTTTAADVAAAGDALRAVASELEALT